ncbi:MAG: DNA polymerase IV [Firmicutes bacterium]|nr:DNA polymerase IV [Bacillota bacterium]
MDRIVMHIDVNNAFLSWTAIDLLNRGYKYDIRNSYAVIGGDERKRTGIVLAKSTAAKKMGVYTGETLFSARKKCPALKSYPPNYQFYVEMSNKLFKLLSKYSPDIEVASVDECYLEYTGVKNLYGDEIEFAKKLQKEIFDTLGFTVNVGIANNKLCAKMASDFEKPNKIHTLYSYEVENKMHGLDVGELFGIGKMSAKKLYELGIKTIGDLANSDPYFLYKYFKNQAMVMINSAKGIDNSLVISESEELKGIGNEITLDHDVSSKQELEQHLLYLADKVARRLRGTNRYAFVVAVILKDKYFKRISRQRKLKNATNVTDEIYQIAKDVLDEFDELEPIRLIGLRLNNLVDKVEIQVSLFDDIKVHDNNENLDKMVDKLKDKFGSNIVRKASLINVDDKKRIEKGVNKKLL